MRSRALICLLSVLSIAPLYAAPRRRAVRPPTGIDEVRRVFLIVLENESRDVALNQPFLHELATRGAYLTNYHSLTHPSQPNYIAMTAGSAYGVTDDDPPNIDVRHLGDLLEDRGLNWKVYAERYPGNCFLGVSVGTRPGQYVRKHVPFLDYINVQQNAERCRTHIVDSTVLDADIAAGQMPEFMYYVPDTKHDGHDTGVAEADAYLAARFGSLIEDPRFMYGTLFVVVFDENHDNGEENVVYCSFFGAGVARGSVVNTYYDHYDLLRTFETIFRTPTLGKHDVQARAINIFKQ